jgi:hypothetical protein
MKKKLDKIIFSVLPPSRSMGQTWSLQPEIFFKLVWADGFMSLRMVDSQKSLRKP